MAVRVSAAKFVDFLFQRYAARDGYIMGATGQNPKSWSKTSWWFTQYKGTQRTQALRWRDNAARVWDCNGLAEGYYKDQTGVSINTRARYNYSGWCNPKGKGTIPTDARIPGAAVFKANSVGTIHHVGYLVAPVTVGKPGGDWYIIEAKGVAYGVIRSKLSDGGWNRWGHMTKYFDYEPAVVVPPIAAPADPPESYNCNWCVATAPVNVRKGPSTGYGVKMKLAKGEAVMYDGAVSGDWYAVYIQGKRYWVSSKFVKIEVHEKPIIDISRWNRIKDWKELAKRVSFVFIRVGYRSLTSGGTIKIDPSFKAHAAAANAAGIPFGAYFYGRAKTATQGAQEAMKAVEWAGPYGPKVYAYDVEVPTNTQAAVQAFVGTAKGVGGVPCGTYIGRRWGQVNGDKLQRDFQWSPYYNTGKKGPSWLLYHGRNPSHPHDIHQYSPSFLPGGTAAGIDVSHINDDPATTYAGHDVLWFRTGGKQGR